MVSRKRILPMRIPPASNLKPIPTMVVYSGMDGAVSANGAYVTPSRAAWDYNDHGGAL
jgi:hypothetical protein